MKTFEIDPQEAGKTSTETTLGYEPPAVTVHHVAQTVQGSGSLDPDAGSSFPGFL